jgi:hypothetical protein
VKQPTSKSPLQHFDLLGYVVSAVILVCMIFVYRISEMVKRNSTVKDQQLTAEDWI